ncbi:unnamed protein product [Polarella glacialis]|uniref:Uncharacterized protein n=1 Tax=Polarella glacialis TaxID=89957 RepID=A0A813H265_POLGL|nr:unnamed protein product [Polarella glacialis]
MPSSTLCLWCGHEVSYSRGGVADVADFLSEDIRAYNKVSVRLHDKCLVEYRQVGQRMQDKTVPQMLGLLTAMKARLLTGLPFVERTGTSFSRLFTRRTCQYHPVHDRASRHRSSMMDSLRLATAHEGQARLVTEAVWLTVLGFKTFSADVLGALLKPAFLSMNHIDDISVKIRDALGSTQISPPFRGWAGIDKEAEVLTAFRVALKAGQIVDLLISGDGIQGHSMEVDQEDAGDEDIAECGPVPDVPADSCERPLKRLHEDSLERSMASWRAREFTSRTDKTVEWFCHFVNYFGRFRAQYSAWDVQRWLPHIEFLDGKEFSRDVLPGPGTVEAIEHVSGVNLKSLRKNVKSTHRSVEEMRRSRILLRMIHNRFQPAAVLLHGQTWCLLSTQFFLCECRKMWYSWEQLRRYVPAPAKLQRWVEEVETAGSEVEWPRLQLDLRGCKRIASPNWFFMSSK